MIKKNESEILSKKFNAKCKRDGVVPFFDMPNVQKLLTCQEYMTAMLSIKGPFGGFLEIVHDNPYRPQWRNFIILENEIENAYIYTKDGWAKHNYDDVTDELIMRHADCIYFFSDNMHHIIYHEHEGDMPDSESRSLKSVKSIK